MLRFRPSAALASWPLNGSLTQPSGNRNKQPQVLSWMIKYFFISTKFFLVKSNANISWLFLSKIEGIQTKIDREKNDFKGASFFYMSNIFPPWSQEFFRMQLICSAGLGLNLFLPLPSQPTRHLKCPGNWIYCPSHTDRPVHRKAYLPGLGWTVKAALSLD